MGRTHLFHVPIIIAFAFDNQPLGLLCCLSQRWLGLALGRRTYVIVIILLSKYILYVYILFHEGAVPVEAMRHEMQGSAAADHGWEACSGEL